MRDVMGHKRHNHGSGAWTVRRPRGRERGAALTRQTRATVSSERGTILVLTAFIIVGLMAISALVVDIVVVHQAQLRAQATVDASVLAAAQDLDDIPTAVAAAQEYALRNYGVSAGDWAGCVDPAPLPVATSVNCISVDDPVAPTHIRVQLPRRSVPAFFARVLGKDSFSVTAAAAAEIEFGITGATPPDGLPTTGDADPADFQEIADFLRAGDPGGGYDKCNPMPNWLDVNNVPPGATKWGEYIFVFEHLDGTTQTVCGTSSDQTFPPDGTTMQWGMDTFIAGTGGASHPGPGMTVHVSCSQNFIAQDGWDADLKGNGPIEGVDTDWHIIRYIGARYQVSEGPDPEDVEEGKDTSDVPPAGEVYIKNACGYSFSPVTSGPPSSGSSPVIRLID